MLFCSENTSVFLPYSGLENGEYGCKDQPRWLRDTLYPQKLALTSLTSGGRSVGIVHLRTKTIIIIIILLVSLNII
jgi:hypothetical protein